MEIKYTNLFSKGLKNLKKQGNKKAIKKLEEIVPKLQNKEKLDPQLKDHKLHKTDGVKEGSRCLHLLFDILLVYVYEGDVLSLEQIGDHHTLKGFKEELLKEEYGDDFVEQCKGVANDKYNEVIDILNKRGLLSNEPSGDGGPQYILKDGRFVVLYDTKGQYLNIPYHSVVDEILVEEGLLSRDSGTHEYGSYVMYYMGAIRINDSSDWDEVYIQIDDENRPTNAQYDAMVKFIDLCFNYKEGIEVMVGFDNDYDCFYSPSDYVADDIIKKIKRYYTTGELVESKSKKLKESISRVSHNEYKATMNDGTPFTMWVEWENGYGTVIAYVGDNWIGDDDRVIRKNIIGVLNFEESSKDEDYAYIEMVQARDDMKRKGIGTAMIQVLYDLYKEVNWGFTTDDGTEFRKGLLNKGVIKESMSREEVLDDMDKVFGQEEPYLWSTYILPNGHFLNPHNPNADEYWEKNGEPDEEHSDFIYYEYNPYGESTFYDCCKINVTYPYITLPDNPTEKQYRAIASICKPSSFSYDCDDFTLSDWVEKEVDTSNMQFPLIVSSPMGTTIFDLALYSGEDIVKCIKQAISRNVDINTLNTFNGIVESCNKPLKESKQDTQKFIDWAGEELANRFFKQKDRMEGNFKDIYYWMRQGEKGKTSLLNTVKHLEDSPTRKQVDARAQEGIDKVYEDSKWLVVKINSFEASKKYGKGTTWCISGENGYDGLDYYNDYKYSDIYFFIEKTSTRKYALIINDKEDNLYTIYNDEDMIIPLIPNAPTVNGLPNVSELNKTVKDSLERLYKQKVVSILPIVGNREMSDFEDFFMDYDTVETYVVKLEDGSTKYCYRESGGVYEDCTDELNDWASDYLESLNEDKKTLYHNTESNFDKFDKYYIGSGFGGWVDGFFFAEEPIKEYGKTLTCEVTLDNPYRLDWSNDEDVLKFFKDIDLEEECIEYFNHLKDTVDRDWSITKALKESEVDVAMTLDALGYDGMIVDNKPVGMKSKKKITEYVVFDENKVNILNKEESLKESKQDIEKFVSWAGKELSDRFFNVKNRLLPNERDVYYWMSHEKIGYSKEDAKKELEKRIKELENVPTRKQRDEKGKEGAKLIYEDNEWLVYQILTYEGAVKYGKGTQWCITGTNTGEDDYRNHIRDYQGGKDYWDSYSRNGDRIYFYISKTKKNRKYALVTDDNDYWTLYNDGDWEEVGSWMDYKKNDSWSPFESEQPHFPIIQGLPDINQEYERCKREVGFTESINEKLSVSKDEVFKTMEDELGSSDTPIDGPSYILPNGHFLRIDSANIDIKGMSGNQSKSGKAMHLDVLGWLEKRFEGKFDSVYDFTEDYITTNCIKVNTNDIEHYVIMPLEKPEEAQFKALLTWLDYLSSKRKNVLVMDFYGSWVNQKEYSFDEYIPDEIIKKIKKYYASGRTAYTRTLEESLDKDIQVLYDKKDLVEQLLKDKYGKDGTFRYGMASLILRDGTIIQCEFHPDLTDFLCETEKFTEDEMKVMDSWGGELFPALLGCTRETMDEYENYLSLPVECTQEQYDRMTEWLDIDSQHCKEVTVLTDGAREVRDSNGAYKVYSYSDHTTDDILKSIKRWYSTGVLVESKIGISEALDKECETVILDKFHKCDDLKKTAMYLMPEGYFLETKGAHRNIEDYLDEVGMSQFGEKYRKDDGSPTLERNGAIRINASDPLMYYIKLSNEEPTEAQYDKLLEVFDTGLIWNWTDVAVYTPRGYRVEYDLTYTSSDEVVRKIKYFYKTFLLM